MRSIELDDVRVTHALGLECTPTGRQFHRFPEWTSSQHTDPEFESVAAMPRACGSSSSPMRSGSSST